MPQQVMQPVFLRLLPEREAIAPGAHPRELARAHFSESQAFAGRLIQVNAIAGIGNPRAAGGQMFGQVIGRNQAVAVEK
jgi:hypothetical protein